MAGLWCPLNMTGINKQSCWMGIHLPGFGTAGLKQAGREVCDKLKIKKKRDILFFFN